MIEKIIVLLIIFFMLGCSDVPKLKQETRKVRFIYGGIMLMSFYLSIDYVFEAGWPNFIELIDFVLGDAAKNIVESLKVSA